MLFQEWPKFLKIFRRRALPNEDFLSKGQLFPRLLDLKALVIGFDTRLNIGLEVGTSQAESVAVDPLAVFFAISIFAMTSGSRWITPGKFIISER